MRPTHKVCTYETCSVGAYTRACQHWLIYSQTLNHSHILLVKKYCQPIRNLSSIPWDNPTKQGHNFEENCYQLYQFIKHFPVYKRPVLIDKPSTTSTVCLLYLEMSGIIINSIGPVYITPFVTGSLLFVHYSREEWTPPWHRHALRLVLQSEIDIITVLGVILLLGKEMLVRARKISNFGRPLRAQMKREWGSWSIGYGRAIPSWRHNGFSCNLWRMWRHNSSAVSHKSSPWHERPFTAPSYKEGWESMESCDRLNSWSRYFATKMRLLSVKLTYNWFWR